MNLPTEDKQLLDNLHSRDKIAFGAIYSRYHKYAFRVAFNMTGNQAESEDLASEAFVRLWTKLGSVRFEKLNGVKAYLAMTVRNAVLDNRKKARVHPIPDNYEYKELNQPLPFASSREQVNLLKTLIRLTPLTRQEIKIIHLLDQEQELRAIAKQLHISYSTARRKRNDAFNKLKLRFEQANYITACQFIEINAPSR